MLNPSIMRAMSPHPKNTEGWGYTKSTGPTGQDISPSCNALCETVTIPSPKRHTGLYTTPWHHSETMSMYGRDSTNANGG